MPGAITIHGNLCVTTLEKTLQEIIRRHEVLRTNIRTVDGEPCQVIHGQPLFELQVTESNNVSEPLTQSEITRQIQQEAIRPFDLASESLIRVHLYRITDTESVLFINQHHIVSDGWSMGIFIKELSDLYTSFRENKPYPLPELPVQYADYAVWQREYLQGEVYQEQADYWKGKLENVPALELPTDKPRPKEQTFNGSRYAFVINKETIQGLMDLGQTNESTLYMILQTLVKVLLGKYTGQSDISIGSPIANRTRSEIENLLGFFVNTIVLRTELDDTLPFSQLLSKERVNTLEAYQYQDMPFEKVVDLVSPERDLSRSPLFQVMVVLQNAPTSELQFSGLHVAPFPLKSGTSKFDLTFIFTQTSNGLSCSIEYNTDLFRPETIQRLAGHFETLDIRPRVDNMAELMAAADLAIGAGGTTSWERCCMGLPSLVCIMADNQRDVAESLEAAGAISVWESRSELKEKLDMYEGDHALHRSAIAAAADVCDGLGLDRVVSRFDPGPAGQHEATAERDPGAAAGRSRRGTHR